MRRVTANHFPRSNPRDAKVAHVSQLDGATSERAANGESFTREAKVGAIWKKVYAKHDSTQAEDNDHAEVKRSILSWEQKTSSHEDKRADQHQQHLLSTATKGDGKFHLTRIRSATAG